MLPCVARAPGTRSAGAGGGAGGLQPQLAPPPPVSRSAQTTTAVIHKSQPRRPGLPGRPARLPLPRRRGGVGKLRTASTGSESRRSPAFPSESGGCSANRVRCIEMVPELAALRGRRSGVAGRSPPARCRLGRARSPRVRGGSAAALAAAPAQGPPLSGGEWGGDGAT